MDANRLASRLNRANNVCVIGAGTMGSGIAAHLANIGFRVTLLDLTTESVNIAFDRAKVARPPHFFSKHTADQIRLGSITDNLGWVSEADWVCEAIIEKLDAKRDLYARIEPLLAEDALISTNTSGLEIKLLCEGRSESFRKRFVGTHFFNPPRYLKLLELIDTPDTHPDVVKIVSEFLETRTARRVVHAIDTPGFIANRYGMWSMYHAIHIAERLNMSIEDVDAITGPFLGRPRSGSFRLNDIVGLDIMEDIAKNQIARCTDDPYIGTLTTPKSVSYLMSIGNIGDKAGKGFYDRIGKDFFAMNLESFQYRPREESTLNTITENAKKPLGERIRIALQAQDRVGEYLRQYLIPALRYADYLKNEVCYKISDFDRVMQWGFGWEMGPFAMIDAIGAEHIIETPKTYYSATTELSPSESQQFSLRKEPQYQTLAEYPVIEKREFISLRDLGEGITSIEFNTKMGSVPPGVVEDLHRLLDEKPNERYVLANPGRAFTVGFDLKFFLDAVDRQDWLAIEGALERLQTLGEKLERTHIVAALHGYSLGGGLELAISCPQVVALSDATIGLPETKVGLIPGGRGVTMMRLRAQDSGQQLRNMVSQLCEGKTAMNAVEARQMSLLRESDVICFHPDMLITTARELAKAVSPTPRPSWKDVSGPVLGMVSDDIATKLKDGTLSAYDEIIADHLKNHMVKASSYEDAIRQERERFIQLCQRAETRARIAHMLESGKPLRN
jgi:3-hydroxyacyl-CoA dehydrogenase